MSERTVTVRIRAEIADFRKQMQQAGQSTTEMGRVATAAGQQTSTAMTQTQAAAAATRVALNEAGKAAQDAAKGFGLSYNSAGQLTDQFGNMVTEAHAAELGLDTASEATREFAAQQQHAAAEAAQATTVMGSLAASARDNEQAWSQVGGALLGFGAAVVAGVGLSIAKYAEFDKAMSEVQAATHETADNMALMREAAITAGADTSFSAKEAADAISELSKAGVTTKDILGGGLAGALSLAAAGSLGVADAAELAATAMTQFKLKGSDLPHVADLLAAGAGKAQGSVEDLGMALKQGGLVAAATGLNIEETTGTLAAFASAGLIGSDAGTSFKTMLQALTPSSKESKAEMERLGISAYDAQGNFIGMSKFAGVLQTSMRGLTDEQRAASQKIIFGSDAVRASNVLYEQGAQGIADWTANVNEAGFAASTAAIKQDNLAGDIEKLGGSIDSVLIKGGGGVAQSLRGMVQGAEDLVDALGQIPAPVLNASVGIAGIAGASALVAGGFITAFPKVMEFRTSMSTLATTAPRAASALAGLGKAAAGAAVGFIALQVVKSVVDSLQPAPSSIEKTTQALIGMKKGTGDVDQLFKEFDGSSHFVADGIGGIGDALHRVNNMDFNETMNKFVNDTTGVGDLLKPAREQISAIDKSMKLLVTSGSFEAASKGFQQVAKAGQDQGVSIETTAKSFPQYLDSLRELASASGVTVTEQELLDWAMGKVPASMQAAQTATEGHAAAAKDAAASSEALAKGLEEVGLSADGSITKIDAFAKALFAAGLLSLSSSDAAIAYQASIDAVTESVIKNGTTLDINTEQGRNNQTAYNGIAKAAMASMEATAAETLATQGSSAAQAELQKNLGQSYQDLITAAGQFGITGDAADTMARKALGIPKEVPIDTWVNDKASSVLDSVKGKADVLDGRQVLINIREETHRIAYEQRVVQSDGNEPEGGGLYGSDRGATKRDGGLINFAKGGQYKGYAMAGYVRGPGTGTSDEINARLSNGEYVIRASKVAQYGVKTFDAYNNGYAAPSKSLAGGYGSTQSFMGFDPLSFRSSAAAPAPTEGRKVDQHFYGVTDPVSLAYHAARIQEEG